MVIAFPHTASVLGFLLLSSPLQIDNMKNKHKRLYELLHITKTHVNFKIFNVQERVKASVVVNQIFLLTIAVNPC